MVAESGTAQDRASDRMVRPAVRRAAGTIAALLIAGVLTWLWQRTQSLVPEEHARIDSALRELRSLDRTINQDVLQARFQVIASYDPVRRSYRRIEALEETIATPPTYLNAEDRERLATAVDDYCAAVTAKQRLIEDFKYRTLTLKDLLHYLPSAATGIARLAAEAGDEPLATAINQLLQHTLLYNLTSEEKYAPLIRQQARDLDVRAAKAPSYVLRRRVRALVIDIHRLLQVKPDVDRTLGRIFEQRVTAHEETVASIYYAAYAAAERAARRYRMTLYGICIALLVLVALAVRRLQRTASALAVTNEHLEDRVLERTQELKTVLDNIAESEAGFRSLIEQAVDGIAVHRDGIIVYATAALAQYLHEPDPTHLIGRPVTDLLPEGERTRFDTSGRSIHAVGERASLGELALPGADGTTWAADVFSVGVLFRGELAIVTTFRDLSERKRIEEQQIALEKSERERLQREMNIATRIQTSLLPNAPAAPHLDIAGRMAPATEVGGDYYDIIPGAGESCWIGIGDVAGHGLDAGLIMLMVQSAIASQTRTAGQVSPAGVLRAVNEALFENLRQRLRQDTFVTATLLRHDGRGGFTFAGAHEDLIVFRAATGRCERVSTPGAWLGITRSIDHTLVESHLQLAPGDLLFLYTDGLTEARDREHEQFGFERLCAAIERRGHGPPDRICADVLDLIGGWQVSQEDDLTALAIRYRGP